LLIGLEAETEKMTTDGETYRLSQAQKLLDLFEKAYGRPATNIRELANWLKSPERKRQREKDDASRQ